IACTINFRCRLIHLRIILRNKALSVGLCNKAVHKYIIKNRMRLAPQMEKVIRDIVLEKLRDSLAKYKNV
ncbi:hypothetical protein MEP47_15645, partial [Acinetobacter baumannii]|nr:hypothetical protein [Acinetobacter baumannii]